MQIGHHCTKKFSLEMAQKEEIRTRFLCSFQPLCCLYYMEIRLEAKSVITRHSILQKGSRVVCVGSQRIHHDSIHLGLHVVSEREKILDAGFKMRVRHPNYCETSSHPISAPNFMLSSSKRNKWRLMMLWFEK